VASNYGGWNKHQLELLGIKWPPQKGWLSKLVGQEVSDSDWSKVMQLRGIKSRKDRKVILATPPLISKCPHCGQII
jgi:hypothetical protein